MEAGRGGWDAVRIGRTALLVLLGNWTLRLVSKAAAWCPLDWVNLPFHEAGHVVLGPFGHTLHVLGGTLFQLAAPAALAVWTIVKHSRPFSAAVCVWWLGESLNNVSAYMADARSLELDLVGSGEHDWNELFFRWHLLDEPSVAAISGATHVAAALIMHAALAWAVVFVLPARVRSGLVLRLATVAPRAVRLLAD